MVHVNSPSSVMCSKGECLTSSAELLVASSVLLCAKLSSWSLKVFVLTAVAGLFHSRTSLSNKYGSFVSSGERIVVCSLNVWCRSLTSVCSRLSALLCAFSIECKEVCRSLSSRSFSQRTLFPPWLRFISRRVTFLWLAAMTFMFSILKSRFCATSGATDQFV